VLPQMGDPFRGSAGEKSDAADVAALPPLANCWQFRLLSLP
jgi:hypothetical protein